MGPELAGAAADLLPAALALSARALDMTPSARGEGAFTLHFTSRGPKLSVECAQKWREDDAPPAPLLAPESRTQHGIAQKAAVHVCFKFIRSLKPPALDITFSARHASEACWLRTARGR
jgi:hypothetical protein